MARGVWLVVALSSSLLVSVTGCSDDSDGENGLGNGSGNGGNGGATEAGGLCGAMCRDFIDCDRGLSGPLDACIDGCEDGYFGQGFSGQGCNEALQTAEECYDDLTCSDDLTAVIGCTTELATAASTCSGFFDPGPCDCSQCENQSLATLCEGFSRLCNNPPDSEEACCGDALARCAS